MNKHIWITAQDRQRLKDCVSVLTEYADSRELPHVQELDRELEEAEVILDLAETPADVITMRSRVRLRDVASGSALECTLVYPSEARAEKQLVSVLAPLGTAMLGQRVGDSFDANLPRGKAAFQVEALLYQPESAGDYHL